VALCSACCSWCAPGQQQQHPPPISQQPWVDQHVTTTPKYSADLQHSHPSLNIVRTMSACQNTTNPCSLCCIAAENLGPHVVARRGRPKPLGANPKTPRKKTNMKPTNPLLTPGACCSAGANGSTSACVKAESGRCRTRRGVH
jgi:hypothetical protein